MSPPCKRCDEQVDDPSIVVASEDRAIMIVTPPPGWSVALINGELTLFCADCSQGFYKLLGVAPS